MLTPPTSPIMSRHSVIQKPAHQSPRHSNPMVQIAFGARSPSARSSQISYPDSARSVPSTGGSSDHGPAHFHRSNSHPQPGGHHSPYQQQQYDYVGFHQNDYPVGMAQHHISLSAAPVLSPSASHQGQGQGQGHGHDHSHHHDLVPPDVFRQGVLEHALSLGMDPAEDEQYLWIAERSLLAPLPPGWVQLTCPEGNVYFYDSSTGESSWDHPSDEEYRAMFQERKTRRERERMAVATESRDGELEDGEQGRHGRNRGTTMTAKSSTAPPSTSSSSPSSQLTQRTRGGGGGRTVCHGDGPSLERRKNFADQHVEGQDDREESLYQRFESNPQSSSSMSLEGASTETGSSHPVDPGQWKEILRSVENMARTLSEDLDGRGRGGREGSEEGSDWDDDSSEEERGGRKNTASPSSWCGGMDRKEVAKIAADVDEAWSGLLGRLGVQRSGAAPLSAYGSKATDRDDHEGGSRRKQKENDDVCEVSELRDRNKELEGQVRDLSTAKESLVSRLEETRSESAAAIEEARRLTEEELEERCRKAEADGAERVRVAESVRAQELESRLRESDETIKRLKESGEISKEDLKSRCADLQREIDSLIQEKDKSSRLKEALQQQLSSEEEELSRCRLQIDHLESRLKGSSDEGNELREDLAHSQDLLKEASKSRDELQRRAQILEENMKEAKDARDKALEEASRAKRQVEAARESTFAAEERAREILVQAREWEKRYRDERTSARRLNDKIVELQGNIRVLCRVRPLSAKEEREAMMEDGTGTGAIQYLDDGRVAFHGTEYEFDRIFAPGAVQGSVFSEVASAVASSMNGHRVCIFAYGQTGSGKTYTMEGPREDRGVNFRALSELFNLSKSSATEMEYAFTVSVLEVYNEQVHDLLAKSSSRSGGCRGDNQGGGGLELHMRKDEVHVDGLIETPVDSCDGVEKLMSLASANRRTASNNVNEHSSRSHLVLSVRISGRDLRTGTRTSGKLNLVDLAGSERLKNTSAEGQRLKEAQNINRSLSALGDVIAALGSSGSRSRGGRTTHVPYRNSKLTFLLADSLRANARVLMFVNINPSLQSIGESKCSLKFALRCRSVQLGRSQKDCTPKSP